MRGAAALKQLQLIASQGIDPHQAIPLMVDLLGRVIPSAFANFCWLDENGWPCDTYMPVVIPSVMDAFIGNYASLFANPDEPSLDKYVRCNVDVGARVIIETPTFRRTFVFNEVFRPLRIRDGLDLTVREGGRARGILFVNRDGPMRAWSAADVAFLRSTHDHFLAALDAAPTLAAGATDRSPVADEAVLVADGDGTILFSSPNAAAMISQYLDVPIAPGLCHTDLLRSLPACLLRLTRRLTKIASGQRSRPARDLRQTRWGEFRVRVYPAGPTAGAGLSADHAIAVIEKRIGRGATAARNLSNLPLAPKERIIAYKLAMGCSGEQICRELSVTRATLRTFVRNIYEQSSVHSRDALISLLTERNVASVH